MNKNNNKYFLKGTISNVPLIINPRSFIISEIIQMSCDYLNGINNFFPALFNHSSINHIALIKSFELWLHPKFNIELIFKKPIYFSERIISDSIFPRVSAIDDFTFASRVSAIDDISNASRVSAINDFNILPRISSLGNNISLGLSAIDKAHSNISLGLSAIDNSFSSISSIGNNINLGLSAIDKAHSNISLGLSAIDNSFSKVDSFAKDISLGLSVIDNSFSKFHSLANNINNKMIILEKTNIEFNWPHKIDHIILTNNDYDWGNIREICPAHHELYKYNEIVIPDNEIVVSDNEIVIPGKTYLPFSLFLKIIKNPKYMRSITHREFEQFIADLLIRLGYIDVILTPRGNDGGKDVIATQNIHDIKIVFYFECKQYAVKNKIGRPLFDNLLGVISRKDSGASMGVLVTTSTFTKGSEKMIKKEPNLDGANYNKLIEWVNKTK